MKTFVFDYRLSRSQPDLFTGLEADPKGPPPASMAAAVSNHSRQSNNNSSSASGVGAAAISARPASSVHAEHSLSLAGVNSSNYVQVRRNFDDNDISELVNISCLEMDTPTQVEAVIANLCLMLL